MLKNTFKDTDKGSLGNIIFISMNIIFISVYFKNLDRKL